MIIVTKHNGPDLLHSTFGADYFDIEYLDPQQMLF